MSFACVVLFGAPGSGKSTLLAGLQAWQSDSVEFVAFPEPTDTPEMQALLDEHYNTKSSTSAFRLQMAILAQRANSYKAWVSDQAAAVCSAAARAGKSVVVVCDGHPRTDALLYAYSKYKSGEIDAASYDVYKASLALHLDTMDERFAQPSVFYHMHIAGDEQSGVEYHRRVVHLRNNASERQLVPKTFARFARYARAARVHLAGAGFATTTIDTGDATRPRTAILRDFAREIEDEHGQAQPVASASVDTLDPIAAQG